MTNEDTGPLPDPERDPEGFADFLFDVVSGTLRDRPEPGAWASPSSRATKDDLVRMLDEARAAFLDLRRDLLDADAKFDALHLWIMAGRPLPSPWRNHFVSRFDDAEGTE